MSLWDFESLPQLIIIPHCAVVPLMMLFSMLMYLLAFKIIQAALVSTTGLFSDDDWCSM